MEQRTTVSRTVVVCDCKKNPEGPLQARFYSNRLAALILYAEIECFVVATPNTVGVAARASSFVYDVQHPTKSYGIFRAFEASKFNQTSHPEPSVLQLKLSLSLPVEAHI